MSAVYSYEPLGLRVLRKIETYRTRGNERDRRPGNFDGNDASQGKLGDTRRMG